MMIGNDIRGGQRYNRRRHVRKNNATVEHSLHVLVQPQHLYSALHALGQHSQNATAAAWFPEYFHPINILQRR